MPTIEETIEFIRLAHAGQIDLGGNDYYLHPLAVMKRLPPEATDDERHAALLHDVKEDTEFTLEDLAKRGYTPRTLWLVDQLSQDPNDPRPYPQKIDALIATGDLGLIRIKYADMSENMDPERLALLAPDVRDEMEKRYDGPIVALRSAILRLTVGGHQTPIQANEYKA